MVSYERGTPVMQTQHVYLRIVCQLEGCSTGSIEPLYRNSSLTKQRTPLGPYHRPMPRVLLGSQGGRRFLVSEVPLHGFRRTPLQVQEALMHLVGALRRRVLLLLLLLLYLSRPRDE